MRTKLLVSVPLFLISCRKCSLVAPIKRRRVVVTGMGLVTCLGVGLEHVWSRLIKGACGITKLDGKEYEKIPCKVAGVVPRGDKEGCLNLEAHIPKSQKASMSLAAQYAMVATDEALAQSGWKPASDEDAERAGVTIGMGMVSMDDIAQAGEFLSQGNYRKINPFFVPRILVNMAAGHVSLKYGLKGPNHSVSTACTTGVHAIGDAFRFIQYGDADLMVCGGTEASVGPIGMAGFARMRALATKFNDSPSKSSRPFDSSRDGFVMSEGAAVVVLEDLVHAKNRNATILGEVLGYGLSGDANHITAPSEDGHGAYRCTSAALKHAGIKARDVGYINAHATATPLGDAAESRAIARLFGAQQTVSSTKGAVGHLLGAAGSVEAVFTLMACLKGHLPPTLNCYEPDEEFTLNYVPLHSQPWDVPSSGRRIALSNSFGFGGTNASLCVAEMQQTS